jgi:hypothetical protein
MLVVSFSKQKSYDSPSHSIPRGCKWSSTRIVPLNRGALPLSQHRCPQSPLRAATFHCSSRAMTAYCVRRFIPCVQQPQRFIAVETITVHRTIPTELLCHQLYPSDSWPTASSSLNTVPPTDRCKNCFKEEAFQGEHWQQVTDSFQGNCIQLLQCITNGNVRRDSGTESDNFSE